MVILSGILVFHLLWHIPSPWQKWQCCMRKGRKLFVEIGIIGGNTVIYISLSRWSYEIHFRKPQMKSLFWSGSFFSCGEVLARDVAFGRAINKTVVEEISAQQSPMVMLYSLIWMLFYFMPGKGDFDHVSRFEAESFFNSRYKSKKLPSSPHYVNDLIRRKKKPRVWYHLQEDRSWQAQSGRPHNAGVLSGRRMGPKRLYWILMCLPFDEF